MVAWVPIVLTLVGWLIGGVLSYAYIKYTVEALKKEQTELKESIHTAIREIHEDLKADHTTFMDAITLFKVTSAEQAIINKFSTGLLNSLNDKVERMEDIVNENKREVAYIKARA